MDFVYVARLRPASFPPLPLFIGKWTRNALKIWSSENKSADFRLRPPMSRVGILLVVRRLAR
jgi:hypothetical protein